MNNILKQVKSIKNLNNICKQNISESVKSQLSVFQEFQQAQDFISNQKPEQSVEYYGRVQQILENVQQKQSVAYFELNKEIFNICQENCHIQSLQKTKLDNLQSIFEYTITNNQYQEDNQTHFINIINELIYTQNTPELAQQVLNQVKQNKELFFKENESNVLQFYEAIVDLIFTQNYEKALNSLKSLQNQNDKLVQDWIINQNMGIAQWQIVLPGFNKLKLYKNAYKHEQTNLDLESKEYQETIQYFQNSIQSITQEDITNLEKYEFTEKNNIYLPLRSLVDFSIDANVDFKQDQNLWMKKYLNYYEKQNTDEIYVPLSSIAFQAMFSGEFMKSEGLYGTVNSMNENDYSVFKYINQFQYGQMISIIDKREEEGQRIMQKALESIEQFPKQSQLLRYVALLKSQKYTD